MPSRSASAARCSAAIVDRRGQTLVLVAGASAAGALLCDRRRPARRHAPAVLVALAAGVGLVLPPVGACMRSLLPSLVPDPAAARTVYAAEASAVEFTWILGPPIALGLGALLSTGAALAIAGLVLLAGTLAFAAQSELARVAAAGRGGAAARRCAAQPRDADADRGALVAVGVLVGAVEVAVAAAADGLGSSAAAGPLLGIWGSGRSPAACSRRASAAERARHGPRPRARRA